MKNPRKNPQNKQIFLYLGLGNPGPEYHETRHNAGFMVIDYLAQKYSVKLKKPFFKNYMIGKGEYQNTPFILIKPLTYMNRSGMILGDFNKYFDAGHKIVVVCDNMDLPYGECRVKTKGGDSGHNGISSVVSNVGSNDFLRIYVGVSRPLKGGDITSHVLGKPDEKEYVNFLKGIERGVSAAAALLTDPIQSVMNEYNRKNNPE